MFLLTSDHLFQPAYGAHSSLSAVKQPVLTGRKKESEHRASGVGSSRVGIGAVHASARPCVAGTMHEPMLHAGLAGRDGSGVFAPARLAVLDRLGGKHPLAVSRMNSGIDITMKHDGGNRVERRLGAFLA